MQLNENDEKIIKDLFKQVTNYYKEYIQMPDDGDFPNQNCVENISAAFRIICQIIESFLAGYKQSQHQYELLEQKLIQAEQEIRNHIKIEQELRVWGESLQDQIHYLKQDNQCLKVKIMTLENEINQQKKQKTISISQERLPTETTQDRQERMLSLLSSQKSRQHQGFKKKNINLQNFDDKQNKSFTQLAQQYLNSNLSKTLRSGITTQKKKKPVKTIKSNQVSLKIKNQRCNSQQDRVKTQNDSFYY